MQRENRSQLSAKQQAAITALLAALGMTEMALASRQFPATFTDVNGPFIEPANW